jgi:hypothetical protein
MTSKIKQVPFKDPRKDISPADGYTALMPQSDAILYHNCTNVTPPRFAMGLEPAIFKMSPEFGGDMKVYLDVEGDNFELRTPLKLVNYYDADYESGIPDAETCNEIDTKNGVAIEHNKVVTSIISMFYQQNGCNCAVGRIVPPSEPELARVELAKYVEKLLADKDRFYEAVLAYLGHRDLFYPRDFLLKDAKERADDIAEMEEINRKKKKGTIRLHIQTFPPSRWDGVSETDSNGTHIVWHRMPDHSFITPHIVAMAKE